MTNLPNNASTLAHTNLNELKIRIDPRELLANTLEKLKVHTHPFAPIKRTSIPSFNFARNAMKSLCPPYPFLSPTSSLSSLTTSEVQLGFGAPSVEYPRFINSTAWMIPRRILMSPSKCEECIANWVAPQNKRAALI